MLTSAAVSQTPLLNLYLSLIFGVGQTLVGPAIIVYVARKKRWRQLPFFVLALIGAWVATSGITELIVSGTELSTHLGSAISAASFQHMRASADTALLIVSLALLVIGAGYLPLARRWRTSSGEAATPASQESDTAQESSQAPSAEVVSSEPES